MEQGGDIATRQPISRSSSSRWIIACALVWIAATAGSATAHDGFSFGLAANASNGGNVALDGRFILPLLVLDRGVEAVWLSGRADVAVDLANIGIPSLGVSAMASSSASERLTDAETYLGAGVGLSFTPDPLASVYAFAGGRLAVIGPLHAVWEVQLAATSGLVAPSVALGFDYVFGSAQ